MDDITIKKVWHINSGPYEDEEVEGLCFLEVLVEMSDGSMQTTELYTGNLDHTYNFMRVAAKEMGPWTAEEVVNITLGYT